MLRSIILIFNLQGGVTRMRRAQDDRLHALAEIGYENGSSSSFLYPSCRGLLQFRVETSATPLRLMSFVREALPLLP
jgi:hypothetical protein